MTHLMAAGVVAPDMGFEWALLGLLVGVVLWLGVDACRESKRLLARLAEVPIDRPLAIEGELFGVRGDWGYWPDPATETTAA